MSIRKEPLNQEEEDKVLNACISEEEAHTMRILLDTGIHVSKFCELTEANIKGNYLEWYRCKNKRLIRIPISQRIAPFIQSYLSNPNRPKWRQYYNKMLKQIGQRAGIPSLSPMSLRHTFGVKMVDKGFSLSDLQKVMGVRNVQVLMTYIQRKDKDLEEKFKKIGW